MKTRVIQHTEDTLFERISGLIEESRQRVKTAVNTAEVYTKYHIGGYIVENEQRGKSRAKYGKETLKRLSERLTQRFGNGWSYSNLRQVRQFFLVYSNLTDTVCQIPTEKAKHCLPNPSPTTETAQSIAPQFALSWSHYLILMRIENPQERSFYEIECREQNWSVRQLQRQYASSLYERLALSSRLAKQTHTKKASHSCSRKRSGM